MSCFPILESLALNGNSAFCFLDFVQSQNCSSLCSLLARTRAGLEQPAASSHLLCVQQSDNKKNRPYGLLFIVNGGNDEARTRDLMRDRHAL